MYNKISFDGMKIETRELNRGWATEKGRIKKYIGLAMYILVALTISLWASNHQASASVSVYQNYTHTYGK